VTAPASSLVIADVWRGRELALSHEKVISSGHSQLDRHLPGGGWPVGHLVEILQPIPGQHTWQLLVPALAQAAAQRQGPVVLVSAPFEPFVPCLQAQGLPPARLLRIQADKPAARLWAAEQSLRCADVAAVMAWLPRANANELRRLHMAAQQHGCLLFVLRATQDAAQGSPARVQLQVDGTDELQVRILKRRGPPLLDPLELPAHPERLAALLKSRQGRGRNVISIPLATRSRSHVLDRTAATA
jgi:protein ImuA